MEIFLAVAADEKNGIGIGNALLCHLPNDLKYFKQLTTGHPVLMGRKTFDSIGRPLPKRLNVVISKTIREIPGCVVYTTPEAALKDLDCQDIPSMFVIGGDSIYKQFLPLASRVYLTRIHHTFEADAFFLALDPKEWKLVSTDLQKQDEKNAYDHSFEVYERSH